MSTTLNSAPDSTQSLDQWLSWLESVHPVAIDMGLDRVSAVADRLGLRPAKRPLILVGGTNGKGSTVAILSSIYQQAGLRVGAYTSPHIDHFCERIKIDGQMVEDSRVVDALATIEDRRMPESLTYFEYTTLAAMHVFNAMNCDVLLFEVGLGGRLDATNIWDADCSIVTSIALDHEEYLGSDVSVIATEKAAIGRSGKPFINGEVNPPASLRSFVRNHDFKLTDVGSVPADQLPVTNLKGDHQRRNAGCAVAAVQALQMQLPVDQDNISHALACVSIKGRFECFEVDGIPVVLDVAHNPAGAAVLVDTWRRQFAIQPCSMVFATMADKDVAGIVGELSPLVDTWYCPSLEIARAASASELHDLIVSKSRSAKVFEHIDARSAFAAALDNARTMGGAVLLGGSFHTIAEIAALGYVFAPYNESCGSSQ